MKPLETGLPFFRNPLNTEHGLWYQIFYFLYKQPLNKLNILSCPEGVQFKQVLLYIVTGITINFDAIQDSGDSACLISRQLLSLLF